MIENPAFLMLRHGIDAIVTFPPSWIVFVLAHGAALFWALRRHDMRPVLLINIVLGAMLFTYNANVLTGVLGYDDFQMLPVVVGLINMLAAGAALAGVRVPRILIWIGFGGVFVVTLALAALFYSLRFDRMI